MFSVTKINVVGVGIDRYTTDVAMRRENRATVGPVVNITSYVVASFETLSEAEKYVREQTIASREYINRVIWVAPEARKEFLDEFITADKFIGDRRYFINMTEEEFSYFTELINGRSKRYIKGSV